MTTNTMNFCAAIRGGMAEFELGLDDEVIARLALYYELVQKWNPRLHLVAPCSPEEFALRHVLESLIALRYLGEGTRAADIGSGGGLPIIPCLIARPSLTATLIESSPKKAVFLREAVGQLGLDAVVYAERFENIPAPDIEFVTCRALERFSEMLPAMLSWAHGATFLLFGGEAVEAALKSLDAKFRPVTLPRSTARYLYLVEPG